MKEKRWEDAYNYAVLDEQVVRNIRENVVKFWQTYEMKFWLGRYNAVRKRLSRYWMPRLGKLAPDKPGMPSKTKVAAGATLPVPVGKGTSAMGSATVAPRNATAQSSPPEPDDSVDWAEIGRKNGSHAAVTGAF
ncbi:hypothetical protein CWS02_10380 [Enterobacter sp. EA-1]|nr:hypothetical protein CWS02_10380 [Enterobacter sp. EA-1]